MNIIWINDLDSLLEFHQLAKRKKNSGMQPGTDEKDVMHQARKPFIKQIFQVPDCVLLAVNLNNTPFKRISL